MPQSPIFPKSVLSIAAGLLLSSAAALSATSANAEASPPPRPVMVALAGASHLSTVAPPTKDAGAPSPMARRADHCIDIPARAAARLAYLQTRLELSTTQAPLFARWKAVKMAAARQVEARCDARFKDGGAQQAMGNNRPSPVDRLAHTEERLQQRLANIRAERPALTVLYASLSDEQKARFDHPGQHGMRGMRHGMMMRHMRGPMRGAMRPMPDSPDGGPAAAPTP